MASSPAQREDSARRAAEVMRLRRQGQTFEAIGEQLGITKQRAHQVYWQTLKAIPAQEVAEYRAEQAERLDDLLRAAYEVLGREHIAVSGGSVVIDQTTGEKLVDDGPKLAAIKTILAIEERRAKLFGLDTPVKQIVGGEVEVTYNFEGVNLGDLR